MSGMFTAPEGDRMEPKKFFDHLVIVRSKNSEMVKTQQYGIREGCRVDVVVLTQANTDGTPGVLFTDALWFGKLGYSCKRKRGQMVLARIGRGQVAPGRDPNDPPATLVDATGNPNDVAAAEAWMAAHPEVVKLFSQDLPAQPDLDQQKAALEAQGQPPAQHPAQIPQMPGYGYPPAAPQMPAMQPAAMPVYPAAPAGYPVMQQAPVAQMPGYPAAPAVPQMPGYPAPAPQAQMMPQLPMAQPAMPQAPAAPLPVAQAAPLDPSVMGQLSPEALAQLQAAQGAQALAAQV